MHKIPTLAELHKDNADAFNNDQLKTLLNCPPNEAWIKTHKGTGVKYMPIDKDEYMLDRIFGRWRIDIKSIFQIENSVVAIIRLWYWNPSVLRLDANGYPVNVNGEQLKGDWDFHDGTGAMPIQVEKDSKASDLSAIKSGAIQMAAPAAVSYAIKDACDHLGRLFGRDITRKDTVNFDPSFKEDPYVNQVSTEDTPPPPPPINSQLAEKLAPKEHTPLNNEPGKLATGTAPTFSANAFAATKPAEHPPAIDLSGLNTTIDF